jgi:hypothetical protein
VTGRDRRAAFARLGRHRAHRDDTTAATSLGGALGPLSRPIEGTHLPADTCRMAEKPEPPPPLAAWSVYKIAKKALWLGIVEAPDERAAIEKAAEEFKVPATKLLVVRR